MNKREEKLKGVHMSCVVEAVTDTPAKRPYPDRRRFASPQTPRHPNFIAEVLEPLALRRLAGEPDRDLSIELYNIIHPWAVTFAAVQCAGLPSHADRNEVLSQVLGLTWDACVRIDWARYAAWPAYLESKISHARVEAARSDDWLSRRERVRRRRFQGELARQEQVEQRSLTDNERQSVACAVAPSSTRVDWTNVLLNARHPSTVADVPDILDGTSLDGTTIEDEVEERQISDIRTRCLKDWLTIVAAQNASLASDLSQWSETNDCVGRELPARLAHRIEPYTPLLLAMLGEAA